MSSTEGTHFENTIARLCQRLKCPGCKKPIGPLPYMAYKHMQFHVECGHTFIEMERNAHKSVTPTLFTGST